MTLRPKYWQKLEAAVKDWPSWVAAVAGQLVLGQGQSFVLQEPSLQLFEKKAKDGAGATSPVAGGTAVPGVVATPKISAPPEPAAPSVDPPADAKIPSRSTPGKLVEVFVSRKSSS